MADNPVVVGNKYSSCRTEVPASNAENGGDDGIDSMHLCLRRILYLMSSQSSVRKGPTGRPETVRKLHSGLSAQA